MLLYIHTCVVVPRVLHFSAIHSNLVQAQTVIFEWYPVLVGLCTTQPIPYLYLPQIQAVTAVGGGSFSSPVTVSLRQSSEDSGPPVVVITVTVIVVLLVILAFIVGVLIFYIVWLVSSTNRFKSQFALYIPFIVQHVLNPRRALSEGHSSCRVYVCVCMCVCVCVCVPALAASASVYTCNQRYSRVSLWILTRGFLKKLLFKIYGVKSQYVNKLELTASRFAHFDLYQQNTGTT